jgi:hypothetical protein
MHDLNRCALGAALVIVISIAGCITLPGKDAVLVETLQPVSSVSLTETPPSTFPQLTQTPSFTPFPTITPTVTPSPTITLTPTQTLIPGWSSIRGDGVSLRLPEIWRGGNLNEDLDQLLVDADGDASVLQQYVKMLEKNREAIHLWAYDTGSTGDFHLTNVNIGQEKVDEAVSVDIYMDAIERNLPQDFTIIGRQLMDINGIPGGKIFIDVNMNGLLIKEVMYITKIGDVMWLITFAAESDTFEAQLELIELSVQTFEIEESSE